MKPLPRLGVLVTLAMIAFSYSNLALTEEKPRPQITENAFLLLAGAVQWTPCGGEDQGVPKGCEFAVLYGDTVNGSSHVLLRVPASARFPKVWHTASEHGVMIRGTLNVRGDDGKEIAITPGTFWYFPGGLTHGGARCGDAESCLFYESYDKPFDVNFVK